MSKHLTADSVIELLIYIQKFMNTDPPSGSLQTEVAYLGMHVSIMEFLDEQSEAFNRLYEKRLAESGLV